MNKQGITFKLQSCVWEITLACCFSCKYCGSKGGNARNHELTTAECLDVAKQLSDLGCRRVSLIGGEVFMRPDWATIVSRLTEYNIRVSIITNGYLFSEELIRKLKETHVESIAISLDGTEKIHDRFRQKGSFHRADKAIDILAENDIPISVITTLHSQNVPYLENLYQYIRSKPIKAWQLQACSPMGNAVKSGIDYHFNFSDVIQFVEKHLYDVPLMMIGIADNIGYFTEKEGYLRGNLSGKAIFSGCRAGLTSIGIDSVGNVRGCESMYDEHFIEGNLREKTLEEIWNSQDTFAYNRQFKHTQLTGKCSSCQYGCLCAGGCRSYNYFTHGKLYEAVNCALNDSDKRSL